MRNLSIALALLILSCLACSTNKIEKELPGIWVYDRMIYERNLGDTSGWLGQQLPYIFDFQPEGKLLFRNCGRKDTLSTWSILSDSVVMIDSIDYAVREISEERVTFYDGNTDDPYLFTLKRPRQVELPYTPRQIEDILLSGTWSIQGGAGGDWQEHFEFFDNHTMIYRYRTFDSDLHDPSSDHIQLENWGVTEYGGFHFFFNYVDLRGNGAMEGISQFLDIGPDSYTLMNGYSETGESVYIMASQTDTREEVSRKIQGEWISHNSKDKSYGRYVPYRLIELGRVELFEGPVRLTVTEKEIRLQAGGHGPVEYQWSLSRDGRTLIMGEVAEEVDGKRVYYDYADILKLDDDKMRLRLFSNSIYPENEALISYILNLIQEFEKKD